jgi:prolyl-tRNA editing enzyme YbaK/EbsC (Cys-tRNA(Pro) deacylase)
VRASRSRLAEVCRPPVERSPGVRWPMLWTWSPPVAAAAGLVPDAEVAPIDATLADTAAFCTAYEVPAEASANCVVVEGRRAERVVRAAVMVLADRPGRRQQGGPQTPGRAQAVVHGSEAAQELTGMRQGGITPVGLPRDWAILVDAAVVAAGPVVIGGGVRGAKLLVDGADLAGCRARKCWPSPSRADVGAGSARSHTGLGRTAYPVAGGKHACRAPLPLGDALPARHAAPRSRPPSRPRSATSTATPTRCCGPASSPTCKPISLCRLPNASVCRRARSHHGWWPSSTWRGCAAGLT